MALPQLANRASASQPAASPAVRRCTYRRLGRVADEAGAGYEVSCLYPDRRIGLPIGDMVTSLEVCAGCTASHIFRPDED